MRSGAVAQVMVVAMLAFGGSVAAQTPDEQQKNCRSPNFDLRLQACTALIQSGQMQGPPLAAVLANRGIGYSAKGQLDRAIQDFTDALAIKPDFAIVLVKRGIAYNSQGNTDRVLADFDQAIRLNPKLAEAMARRAIIDHARGKDDQAIAELNRAVEAEPRSVFALTTRARLFAVRNDYDPAVVDFGAALAIDPTLVDVYHDRAAAYTRAKKPDQALPDWEAVVRLAPNAAESYYNRGVCQLTLGHADLAMADFDRTIQLDPRYFSALNNRGYIFLGRKELTRQSGISTKRSGSTPTIRTPIMGVHWPIVQSDRWPRRKRMPRRPGRQSQRSLPASMLRVVRWIVLSAALSGAALAQTQPGPEQNPLLAFGKAFVTTRRLAIDAVPARTLVVRAVHGLAAAPILASQAQQRVIAAATAQLGAMAPEDVTPLLHGFGDLLDALHAAPGGPPLDAMLRPAIAGMLDGLDPQTRFIPPPPALGEAGIGLKLTADAHGTRVIRAYTNSPAAKAGVQPGDEIISVDGHPTQGQRTEAIAALLRGPVGSPVTLLLRRAGAPAFIRLELTRAVIRIALITGRMIGSTAYLHIEEFAPGAAPGLRRQYADLQSQSASSISGIVLDLRDNGGGRLTEAVATADELLPASTLIATTTGRETSENQRLTAGAGDITGGLPMVVLVNEGTGAGSEIVASALQTGRGAILMGSHTAGAGMVATVIPIPPLGAMSLTTQRINLASGQKLVPPGLLPQVALIAPGLDGSAPSTLEEVSRDPVLVRLRRGISQTPQAGEPFDVPDAPEPDFEMRQAVAALAMLRPGPSSQP